MALIDQPRGDEPGGEPVEQFGMTRRFAAEAEVGRGRDDPPAEVVLPDPVDHHPGRQRIARAGSASAPARAARSRLRRRPGWRLAVQERKPRNSARHDRARTGRITAAAGVRRRRLALGDGIAPGRSGGSDVRLQPDQLVCATPPGGAPISGSLLDSSDRDRPLRASSIRSLIRLELRLGPAGSTSGTKFIRGKPFDWSLLGAGVGEARAGEHAVEGVIVALADGSNLWSWHRAQRSVRPRKARPVVSIASSRVRCQSSKGPVAYRRDRARKPVATTDSA